MNENSQNISFVRWQKITREQFTYALNLILSFSIATLGFGVTLLINSNFNPESCEKIIFAFSLLFLFLSVLLGIFCVINRLHDFRLTMKTARKRENDASDAEIESLRTRTKKLGNRSWHLFYVQIGSYGIGVTLMIVVMVSAFIEKLL